MELCRRGCGAWLSSKAHRLHFPGQNDYGKKLGISEEITVIGHVGRFTYQKNHEKIIDIFEQYNKNNPNSVLLLVGWRSMK